MSAGPNTVLRTVSRTGLRTLTGEVSAETEEKKSRFLAFVVPHARFADRLAELRAEHPKANHHVTAFRAMRPDGRIEEGAKDDGEPSGTSGMPILRLLIGEGLVDVGAIVVRYFGGTKLGTGGLARAYPGAVKAALAAAAADGAAPPRTTAKPPMAPSPDQGCRTGAGSPAPVSQPALPGPQRWNMRSRSPQKRPSGNSASRCRCSTGGLRKTGLLSTSKALRLS